jgi:hypothetical protein
MEANMLLKGSCHCGAVKFEFQSHTPYPYQRCYCSICRKLNGGGGYTINIMGKHDTLQVDGEQHINVYRSKLNDRGAYEADGLGFSRRHFCKHCGTMLWNYNPRYGSWFYPFASAIDTPLPVPPERAEIMLDYKPSWCEVPEGPKEKHFARYPDEGIEDWHKKRGLYRD